VLNVAGGLASNGLELIAVRGLLGIAEALVISSVVSTIGSYYEDHERVIAYGLWTAVFGAGSAFGPIAGGLLAEGPGWRWIFFGCAPIAVIAILFAAWLVPESRTAVPPHWDPASITTSVLGLGAVVYALQHITIEPLAAASAGVLLGDILVAIGEKAVDDTSDVQLFLDPGSVGKPTTAKMIRGGALQTLTITVGERK